MKKVAKNNYYGEPKPIESLVVKSDNLSETQDAIQEKNTWDFTKMTIEKLGKELESSINNHTPIFLWSKERLNNKIRLDNDKQILILEKIQNLRAITKEFSQLQADAIFSEQFIKYLVAEKQIEAEQILKELVATHQFRINTINTNIKLTTSQIDHDQIEKDRKRAENERTIAEVEKIRAETDTIHTQNELKRLVMSKINFDNFPPAYISELLAALSNINIKPFSQFEMEEKLKDIYFNMEKTKARKAEVEVDDFMNSAEFRKWKNDRAKRDAEL
ncbi:MAG: hypothetical protein P4L27_05440 [Ignavibacteriaceae bacterium]|nr:hypothetical protein [Ignavibacteriaceae bacterium]